MNLELSQIKHCFPRLDSEDGGHCPFRAYFSTDGTKQVPRSVIPCSGRKEAKGERKKAEIKKEQTYTEMKVLEKTAEMAIKNMPWNGQN